MDIKIPEQVRNIMSVLEAAGFEAFVVGGCVRDAIMGREPEDWDVCTSATPEEVKAALEAAGIHTFDTGIRHGTVTALAPAGYSEHCSGMSESSVCQPEIAADACQQKNAADGGMGEGEVCQPEIAADACQQKNAADGGMAEGEVCQQKNAADGGMGDQKIPVEITTYRIDGEYLDGRHPENVTFTRSIEEDLARRDFTMNAMAWDGGVTEIADTGSLNDDYENGTAGQSCAGGLSEDYENGAAELSGTDGKSISLFIDPYGGREDIENETIRCVGDPEKRFGEDALRIMRAIRFSAVLGFAIEPATDKAIHQNFSLLENVSRERICAELSKLVMGDAAGEALWRYRDVIEAVMPEIIAADWKSGTAAVNGAAKILPVRLAVLFGFIKAGPLMQSDEEGLAKAAAGGLRRLKFDNQTIDMTRRLISLNAGPLADDRVGIKYLLKENGEETVRMLIEVRRAMVKATGLEVMDFAGVDESGAFTTWAINSKVTMNQIDDAEATLDSLIAARECFSLQQLAVKGADLIEAGITPGPAVGEKLEVLLDMVIEGRADNEKNSLLALI